MTARTTALANHNLDVVFVKLAFQVCNVTGHVTKDSTELVVNRLAHLVHHDMELVTTLTASASVCPVTPGSSVRNLVRRENMAGAASGSVSVKTTPSVIT